MNFRQIIKKLKINIFVAKFKDKFIITYFCRKCRDQVSVIPTGVIYLDEDIFYIYIYCKYSLISLMCPRKSVHSPLMVYGQEKSRKIPLPWSNDIISYLVIHCARGYFIRNKEVAQLRENT